MNPPTQMDRMDVLRSELEFLKREHRDLDSAIGALDEFSRSDQFSLSRLKRKKLGLKDRIARIEDVLFPDIIA